MEILLNQHNREKDNLTEENQEKKVNLIEEMELEEEIDLTKKEGHGRSNWGGNQSMQYKQKGDTAFGDDKDGEKKKEGTEGGEEGKKEEEVKVKEEEKVVEEIIGVSLDDFKKEKFSKAGSKKEGREAEGIKGAKVEDFKIEKVHQETILKNQYGYSTHAKAANSEQN